MNGPLSFSTKMSGMLFQQSLQDLVKSIRLNRRDEENFLTKKHAESVHESFTADIEIKATGILKLTYLQLFGKKFDIAAFQVVEVMHRSEFAWKRIGYFAASQSFSPMTDVLLLTTNQFKKDLNRTGQNRASQVDSSLALSCLARICTEELGRDISDDVFALMESASPYLRKKAVLTSYKVCTVHPEVFELLYPKLRLCLADEDNGVVCAAVTVLCEISKVSPQDVVPYARDLYELLQTCKISWIKIKAVKIMGRICVVEKRLEKKVLKLMTDLMSESDGKALLYECCKTVAMVTNKDEEVLDVIVSRLEKFIVDSDQNLKFLGLTTMIQFAREKPSLIKDQRKTSLILDCFNDQDVGIRRCALELIECLITKRNFRDFAKILVKRIAKGFEEHDSAASGSVDMESEFLTAVLRSLLETGKPTDGKDGTPRSYSILSTEADFQWYLKYILFEVAQLCVLAIARSTNTKFSKGAADLIAEQLVEITGRVQAVRKVALELSINLLSIIRDHSITDLSSLVAAGAFIIGENADVLNDISPDPEEVMKILLDADVGHKSSKNAQLKIVYACLKIYTISSPVKKEALSSLVEQGFATYLRSEDPEIQERAFEVNYLLKSRLTLSHLFSERLRPVDGSLQKLVTPPVGLNIDEELDVISDIEDIAPMPFEVEQTAPSPIDFSESSFSVGTREEKSPLAKPVPSSVAEWTKQNHLFYLSGSDEAKSNKVNEGILLDLDDQKPSEAAETSRVADVFFSTEEVKSSAFDKDDYSTLMTPTNMKGEDLLFPKEGQTSAKQKVSSKKPKKGKKKKTKKSTSASTAQATGTEGLLIDLGDDSAGRQQKPVEQNTQDVLDMVLFQ